MAGLSKIDKSALFGLSKEKKINLLPYAPNSDDEDDSVSIP